MLQLIYASAATPKFSPNDLTTLLVKSRTNNIARSVTGMMLYHVGSFLQVLEGEEEDVDALYSAIEIDDRHTNLNLLYRGPIDEREFEDWSMGFVNTTGRSVLPDGFLDYATQVQARTIDKTRAKKILKMFQQGTWRQKIDR